MAYLLVQRREKSEGRDLASMRSRLGSCLGVVSVRDPTADLLDELLGEPSRAMCVGHALVAQI